MTRGSSNWGKKKHPQLKPWKKRGEARNKSYTPGTTDPAKIYVTRSKAVRKLGLTLHQFRKLCILKGIYPRVPKKKSDTSKSYYYMKDVNFIYSDPLVQQIKEYSVWKRHIRRARGRDDRTSVKALIRAKPDVNLDYLVTERYPSFQDALSGLDDALSMVFLFARLPSSVMLKSKKIQEAIALGKHLKYFIMRSHSLRKVFVSVKGYYYQADIMGETVTWIEPHNFAVPGTESKSVDLRVMRTFLDFYEVLLGFVNFKLYKELGLDYPPVFNKPEDSKLIYDTITVQSFQREGEAEVKSVPTVEEVANDAKLDAVIDKATKEDGEQKDQVEAETKEVVEDKIAEEDMLIDDEARKQLASVTSLQNLFKGCVFYLSREVPLESLEFTIISCGGEVTAEESEDVTHVVSDRGFPTHIQFDREYIQPQWVYDSVNNSIMLPTEGYTPGTALPPHLSPFVDDAAEGYVPAYREKLQQFIQEARGDDRVNLALAQAGENIDSESEEDDDALEKEYEMEMAEEGQGNYEPIKVTKKATKKKRKQSDLKMEEERIKAATSLLTSKKRWILKRHQASEDKIKEKIGRLVSKRRKLDTKKNVKK